MKQSCSEGGGALAVPMRGVAPRSLTVLVLTGSTQGSLTRDPYPAQRRPGLPRRALTPLFSPRTLVCWVGWGWGGEGV